MVEKELSCGQGLRKTGRILERLMNGFQQFAPFLIQRRVVEAKGGRIFGWPGDGFDDFLFRLGSRARIYGEHPCL
jgi:hypothetical protein